MPATKASPKEMLPIVDKPLIQYAVEEAIEAGAEKLIFITGSSKRAIEDHFDKDHELERALQAQGKEELLQSIRDIVPARAQCVYIRQSAPLGLGHAVLCARSVVGDEPFYVHLADDLIDARVPALTQMARVFENSRASMVAVETVPEEETHKYGIVKVNKMEDGVNQVLEIVEKPKPEVAPSNLAVVGRYVLTPGIFDKLENTERGAGGEIQLTDGIAALLEDESVLAYEFGGVRYDCGTKLGYLQANVELGLKHETLGQPFLRYLKQTIKGPSGF